MSTLRPLLAELPGAVKQYGTVEDTPTNRGDSGGASQASGARNSNNGNGNFSTSASSNRMGPRPRVIRAPPRIPLMIRELWDDNVRRSTDWAFLNACYGVMVMILLNEIPWYLPQWALLAMQASLSITTCILLYQLFELRWYQRRIRLAELVTKRRKVVAPIPKVPKPSRIGGLTARVEPQKDSRFAAKYPLPHLSKWALLKQSLREPEFWLMNLVYVVHLPPAIIVEIPAKFGLLMFLRIWIMFDVLRMHSEVYKQRHANKTLLPDTRIIYSRGVALRTFIYDRPLTFAFLSVTGSITIFGYCIHVLERANTTYTFLNALWVSSEAVLFMWPADVYEDYNPTTWSARLVCILTSLVGLAITAFCVGATFDQILSTPQEKRLVLWIRYAAVRKQEVDRAARLIQYVMRTYLHEEKLKKQYEETDPEKLEQLLDAIDDEWYDIVALHSSDLRRLRMDRIDLEVEWRKYTPDPIPSWQLDTFSSHLWKDGRFYDTVSVAREYPRETDMPVEQTEGKTGGPDGLPPHPPRRDPYVAPDHLRDHNVATKLSLLHNRVDDLASELRNISQALLGNSGRGSASSSNNRQGGSGGAYSRGSCSVVSRRAPEPARGRNVTPRSADYTSSGSAKHWDTGYYSSS